jgi:hypothetical protein
VKSWIDFVLIQRSRVPGKTDAHRCGDCSIFGHGAKGIWCPIREVVRLLRESVEWNLSGHYSGCVYFAAVAGGDTGAVFGAVFVAAARTVIVLCFHQIS